MHTKGWARAPGSECPVPGELKSATFTVEIDIGKKDLYDLDLLGR